MRRTLGEVLDDRGNSLTPIRLFLAGLVLVAHAASVSGLADHPLVGGVGLGTWAVMAFFAISGYLIAQSRTRLALRGFLVHRAARILPGFWVANVLTAAVAAPIAAHLAGTRLDIASAVTYPLRNAFLVINQWTIAGTLEEAPFPDVWNGSLWTLAQEGAWYLVVGLAFLFSVVRRNMIAFSGLLLLTMTALNWVGGVPWAVLGAFFAAGMLLHSLRDRVRVMPSLLAVAATICVLAGVAHEVVLLAPLPLGYLVLAGSAVRLPGAGMRSDLSYGAYIYAFPVSQVLALTGLQNLGLAPYVLATMALTAALAWFSWRLVERPSLDLARRRAPRPIPRVLVTESVRSGLPGTSVG